MRVWEKPNQKVAESFINFLQYIENYLYVIVYMDGNPQIHSPEKA
jgi:hypothetical protein